jgi:hypothetical protein
MQSSVGQLLIRTTSEPMLMLRKAVPAQSSIRYKNVVFTSGIDGDLSPYQGLPTPENNALWVELYDCKSVHSL